MLRPFCTGLYEPVLHVHHRDGNWSLYRVLCFDRVIFTPRLQNSQYFCVFKYARAVKQKVWNEAENGERNWGETLKIRALSTLTCDYICQARA